MADKLDDLVAMLEEGKVDGALELYAYKEGPTVGRMFPDYRQQEADYFRQTGIFPIFHSLVLRPEATEGRPQLIPSLLEAFRASVGAAHEHASAEELSELEWEESVVGDPYAPGLGESEQRAFDLLNWALVQEGLLSRAFSADEFFYSGV
jgi:4,5-dihydroxyphthalate decarboxylase